MEDEGEVLYETALDTEQYNNENGRNEGFESRQARKRRKSKRRQQFQDPREAHENLSQLSNSIDKQHFSYIEGNVGRYDSLITAKRLKMHNSRQLQSLESRFQILQRNEANVLTKIEQQRQRAEILANIKESRERERQAKVRYQYFRSSEIQHQKLHNYKQKEGRRLNLSLVN